MLQSTHINSDLPEVDDVCYLPNICMFTEGTPGIWLLACIFTKVLRSGTQNHFDPHLTSLFLIVH